MAGVTGLEPATSGVTGQRSNQLSYTPAIGVAHGVIHPAHTSQSFRHGNLKNQCF